MADLTLSLLFWGRSRLVVAPGDWQELARRLRIGLPGDFPWPSGWVNVDCELEHSLGPNGPGLRLAVHVEAHPDAPVGFLGVGIEGPVRLSLRFDVGSAAEADALLRRFSESSSRLEVSGELQLEVGIRLPRLPAWDILRLEEEGNPGLRLRLSASFEARASGDSTAVDLGLRAELVSSVRLLCLPPGGDARNPWLELSLTGASGELVVDQSGRYGGRLSLAGEARGYLDAGWMVTPQTAALESLIGLLKKADADRLEIRGQLSGSLAFEPGGASLTLEAGLPDARVRLSLQDVLAWIRSQVRGQQPPARSVETEDDLDEAGLALSTLQVRLSRAPRVGLGFRGKLPGLTQEVPVFLSLAHRETVGFEFSVGIGLGEPGDPSAAPFRIPLSIPAVSREELEPFAALQHRHLRNDGLRRYKQAVDAYLTAVEAAAGLVDAGRGSLVLHPQDGGWRVEALPDAPRPSAERPVVIAVGRTSDGGELGWAYGTTEGWQPLIVKPALQFEQFAVVFPVTNPRDLRVSGTMRFTCEGPFEALSRLPVTAGLSVDMLYASVDTDGGVAIEVPPLLPGYEPGRLVLGQLRLGIGYTKRSFAFAFAGECVLPRQLVDDLDTTERLGFGIRLPERSNLALRFDLIPIVLGKVVIPLPMLQLNCDLRRPGGAGLIRNRLACEPGWDGLQLVAPGILRIGLERFSYNPILGGLFACSNSDFAGDLQVGDERTGITACLDNGFWAYGFDSYCSMLLYPLISPPFFDDACLSLRLGGFGFGFDLQRPLPTFSPFALFELLALVSDPLNYPVAPRGELADMLRVTLLHPRLTLPAAVAELLPDGTPLAAPPDEATINLGSYIRLLQAFGRLVEPLIRTALAARDPSDADAGIWRDRAARLRVRDLPESILEAASALPATIRQFTYRADLLGFSGEMTLGFGSLEELRAALEGGSRTRVSSRGLPSPPVWDAEAMDGFLPKTPSGHLLAGAGPSGRWSDSEGFSGIQADDLAEVPLTDPPPRFDPEDITAAFVDWLRGDRGKLAQALRRHADNATEKESLKWKRRAPTRREHVGIAALLNQAIGDPRLLEGIPRLPLPAWLAERYPTGTLQGDRLRRYHRLRLELALPGMLSRPMGGILGAGSLRAFGLHLRLIGWFAGDGDFRMVSRGELEPLRIPIPGGSLLLGLKVRGRLILRRASPQTTRDADRSDGELRLPIVGARRASRPSLSRETTESVVGTSVALRRSADLAVLEGSGFAEGELLPRVMRLSLGTEKEPVSFQLWSRGRAHAGGTARAEILDGVLKVEGRLELEDERLLIAGGVSLLGVMEGEGHLELRDGSLFIAGAFTGSLWGEALALGFQVEANPRAELPLVSGTCAADLPGIGFRLDGTCRCIGGTADRHGLFLEGEARWKGRAGPRARLELTAERWLLEQEDRWIINLGEALASAGVTDRVAELIPGLGDLRIILDLRLRVFAGRDLGLRVQVDGRWSIERRLNPSFAHQIVATDSIISELGIGGPGLRLFDLAELPLLPIAELQVPALPVLKARDVKVALTKARTLHVFWEDRWHPPLPPGAQIEREVSLPDHFNQVTSQLRIDQLPRIATAPLRAQLQWVDGELCLGIEAPGRFQEVRLPLLSRG